MKKITKILPILFAATILASCGRSSSTSVTSNTSTTNPTSNVSSVTTPTSKPTTSNNSSDSTPSIPNIDAPTRLEDFTFTENLNGTLTITNYAFRENAGSASAVVIPSTGTDGKTISGIANNAFYSAGGIVSISIPSTITSLAPAAFTGCTTIRKIEVAEDNPNFSSKDGWLLSKDEKTAIYCPSNLNNSTSIELVDGVEIIGQYCFTYNQATTINLDNGELTTIGNFAFHYSKVVTTAIPNSVTTLGTDLFTNSRIANITIGTGVTEIPTNAFKNSNDLITITIPSNVKKISASAFERSHITTITFSEGLETIDEYAFYFCRYIDTITFPSTLETIGNGAFSECTGLARINLNEGLKSIGTQSFYYTNISSLKIPASVEEIRDGAFGLCTYLTTIEVDQASEYFSTENNLLYDHAKTRLITYAAFATKPADGTITLPNGLTRIEDFAFAEAYPITTIIIPATLTYIGGSVFTRGTIGSASSSPLTIDYAGTIAQWNAVAKGTVNDNPWNYNITFAQFKCSDGDIDFSSSSEA